MTAFMFALALKAQLTIVPQSLDFGTVRVGEMRIQSFNVVNTGDEEVGNIQVYIDGPFSFEYRSHCVGPLNPNQSCFVDIIYRPMFDGYENAWVNINGTGVNTRAVVMGQGRR